MRLSATGASTSLIALNDGTITNKVFAPALSQDLAFAKRGGDIEVLVAFEGGSKMHRSMVDSLGWSVADGNVYSLRLPKFRSKGRK